jgi:hypothetical protein
MEECNQLAQYDNTRKLYEAIKKYMVEHDVSIDTAWPIVTVNINYCIKTLAKRSKPKEKVQFLCFKYLEEINYPVNI